VPSALPPGVVRGTIDFNGELDVTIPNAEAAGLDPPLPPPVVAIPAYDASAYPQALAPMPITGYNAGNYFDPEHAGEGIVVEVGDRGPTAAEPSRYVALAWFTYDTRGEPLWLSGVAPFPPGVRALAVTMAAFGGGGFAGSFGSAATAVPWGTVSIAFPDCTSMHFEYASRPGLPAPLPAATGERRWTRLSGTNGLPCK
jgi:hypothetical protein